jgi:hypothetical protein
MKPLTAICFLLFLIGVALSVAELWFHVWGTVTFTKIILTDAGLFAVCFVFDFIVKEGKASKNIQKGNSLD